MKAKKLTIEVIAGPEGPCLSIGNKDTGFRLAGPKPWGGGKIIHRFTVDYHELLREAKRYAAKSVSSSC